MALENHNRKEMYGVEHCYNDGSSTYEIFETLSDAKSFCQNEESWSEDNKPLFIFKADFNSELIYLEDGSSRWNYDDFNMTILGNFKNVKVFNTAKELRGFVC